MATKLPATITLSEVPRVVLHIDWLTFTAAPPVKTVSMATQGMLHFGQKELVLCLKQYSNDHIKSAIEIFRLITDMAAQGQLVDVNGLSEFAANGLFDRPGFTGIAYARCHSIEPVLQTIGVEKQNVLSMILLTPGEVAVMKCFGLARVLSRICADSRYFPYPLWNDLDRVEAIGQDEIGKCYLQNFSQHPTPVYSQYVTNKLFRSFLTENWYPY